MNKLALTLFASGMGLASAFAAGPTDWPSYGNDAAGGRFSPLNQVTPANVKNLKLAWTYHMNPTPQLVAAAAGGRPRRAPASTASPLEVNGVLYLATPFGRVVALNAETGKQIWAYALPTGDQPPFRGVNYWPGDSKAAPEILFGTINGNLIAIDARTGERMKGFGIDGIVNLKTPEIMNGFPNASYSLTAPGILYHDLLILGSRVQETPQLGPSGDVRAFDVRTGKLMWTFHGIPQPGEKFHDTWQGDSWKQRSGVNVWNMMSVDTARGIAYLPFGAPTVDRYGGDHKGANLFSSSLVAVDAATGKYLWHFQLTHHDIWDLDALTTPVLLTVKKDGKSIPAVAMMNKAALLFLLNRVTGEPIYKVTETPVPTSDAPGEEAWPTQPIPEKPAQLTRNSFALDEVADVTPELKAYCEAWIARDHLKPSTRYQPISADVPMIHFPSAEGGPEWGGGAFDPKLGYFIINTNDRGSVEKIVKLADGSYNFTTAKFNDPQLNMPCQQPPWGELTAVNVNTGEIAWRIPLGVTDNAPPGKQNTGRVSNGGPIVTASGLTFIAGTDDARFRAFDSKTGKEIWTYKLDFSGHATPITYMGKNGKQYVALVATGGSYLGSPAGGDSLLAFTLP
jgi:quinoprotein glucose dehydrogenase